MTSRTNASGDRDPTGYNGDYLEHGFDIRLHYKLTPRINLLRARYADFKNTIYNTPRGKPREIAS